MRHCFVNAYAKINLTLDVLGKREDGYHELCMIMQSVSLKDVIAVRTGCGGEDISITANVEYLPNDERNIAFKAARAFYKESNITCDGLQITIEKKIPVAAGLAGGSSDAAAVLKALNTLYQSGLSDKRLCEIGRTVGADVPFCILGGTMLAEGVGERLTSLPPMPDCTIVLVKPQFGMSTQRVFGALDCNKIERHPGTKAVIAALEQKNLQDIATNMYNVLEEGVSRERNDIGRIRGIFDECGALGSVMSGSGSATFGVFDNIACAEKAFERLKRRYKDTFMATPVAKI